MGVKNLRVFGSSQGPDSITGRVVPSLEYDKEVYNQDVWQGLDVLLDEMGKRSMKAVVVLSNFYPWTGGFQQIMKWYNTGSQKNSPYDFFEDTDSVEHLKRFIGRMIMRNNTVNHRLYRDDPTIMAWQLANDPKSDDYDSYYQWINHTSKYIHDLDKNHLISIGNEGTNQRYSHDINHLPFISYITFHAFPEELKWFAPVSMKRVIRGFHKMKTYMMSNTNGNKFHNKPVVLEAFGLGRDNTKSSYKP